MFTLRWLQKFDPAEPKANFSGFIWTSKSWIYIQATKQMVHVLPCNGIPLIFLYSVGSYYKTPCLQSIAINRSNRVYDNIKIVTSTRLNLNWFVLIKITIWLFSYVKHFTPAGVNNLSMVENHFQIKYFRQIDTSSLYFVLHKQRMR